MVCNSATIILVFLLFLIAYLLHFIPFCYSFISAYFSCMTFFFFSFFSVYFIEDLVFQIFLFQLQYVIFEKHIFVLLIVFFLFLRICICTSFLNSAWISFRWSRVSLDLVFANNVKISLNSATYLSKAGLPFAVYNVVMGKAPSPFPSFYKISR